MASQHRGNRGSPGLDGNDDDNAYDINIDSKKPLSDSTLRRRHTGAAQKMNGEYRLEDSPERKHDGEADVNRKMRQRSLVGFPKSLSPFVHVRETDATDAPIDPYNSNSRSQSPELDVEEGQQLQNRTITYDRENSMHASFLTNDSGTDFDTSLRSNFINEVGSDKPAREQKEKTLDDPPSVDSESPKSFRRSLYGHPYDKENDDEIVSSDNNSYKTRSDTEISKDDAPDPNSLYGKFQLSRRYVGRLVNNEYVQLILILLITLNGILIGFSTTQMVKGDPKVETLVETIDTVFLVIFTIELLMQFYYYAFALFYDLWLVFDLIVVVLSWIAFAGDHRNTQGEFANNDFTVLRAFRIFRIARLVTRIRPLRDLVLALGEVIPRMSAIVLLLFVVFYVFAVLFTERFSQYDLGYNYFTTLHDSFLSCFQMMTMEWVDICRPLLDEDKHAWIFIVIFVMIAGFIVFNLIVAVVVQAVSQTEETVRRLDGRESNSPASKLAEAEERVDLLMSHLNEMMEQQEQIQFMLETMAGELLHLETERMKAKYRENRLREEINRRIENEKKAAEEGKNCEDGQQSESVKKISMQFLEKMQASKAQRKIEEEEAARLAALSENESVNDGQSVKKKKKRRNSMRSNMSRDGSGKSIGTNQSADSGHSDPDTIDSPIKSVSSSRARKLDSSSIRTSSIKKASGKEESRGSEDTSDRKKKAIGNWKKLIAIQKDFEK